MRFNRICKVFLFFSTFSLFFVAFSIDNSINYRSEKINFSNYDMVYESGNFNHPDYSKPFKFFGNHRILLNTSNNKGKIVHAVLPWRRRDLNPHEKDVVIVNKNTGKVIENLLILNLNNEFGDFLFEKEKNCNLYYVYYLPHTSTGGYYPKLKYNNLKNQCLEEFFNKYDLSFKKLEKLNLAKVVKCQSIDKFHSFFPMEIIATKNEVKKFFTNYRKSYYVFPEYREFPVKMENFLPVRFVKQGKYINGIKDNVLKGEYYTFQIALFSPLNSLKNVKLEFSDLKGKNGILPKKLFTNFNTEGVDLNGKLFEKTLNVNAKKVQPLWCGIDIPMNAKDGEYFGKVKVKPEGLTAQTVFVKLNVLNKKTHTHGDEIPDKMSRLRWLNSTIGIDDQFVMKPFVPVKVKNKTLSILGRELKLNENGLPENIFSYFSKDNSQLKKEKEAILKKPMEFFVLNQNGAKEKFIFNPLKFGTIGKSKANWEVEGFSNNFKISVKGTLEYDGYVFYKIDLTSINETKLNDIKLIIPFLKDSSKYMMGLGFKGGKLQNCNWKWNVKKYQEGVWLGNVNKGLQYVLRDENYERPLNTNFYHNKPLNLPKSWFNKNKGGINIKTKNSFVEVENYTGARNLKKGETLHFYIRFLITPFKPINTKEHFKTRFVHKYLPIDQVKKLHGTVVNVHHAYEINPYINYPFYNIQKQKKYIENAHRNGIKVKLYNTIRELSYKAYELYPLRSLGFEVLNDGKGGGHSWLQEHLESNYHSAWHATQVDDASILNKGNSRWTNYYIEGINWLAKNQKIDGLYLDDMSFNRATMKRIANVFSKTRGNYVIDLHSANQFNDKDGYINSAFLYMEHFPYIQRLWFGEYFEYNMNPDYWLVEVSGIPFGLTGEMLEKGGHPYRGLVYGMTTRVYGKFDPSAIWKIFDDFQIENSKMFGYWMENSPIKIEAKGIKSTIYVNGEKVLIAIGSWIDKKQSVKLKINFQKLGFTKSNCSLICPEIKGLQNKKNIDIEDLINIENNQGLILILENKNDN